MKIQELADNFSQIGAVFEPKVVTHTLEDGTKSKEIIAVPEAIQRSEETYKEVTIYKMELGERDWGIYYALTNQIAVISLDMKGIKNTIDLLKGADNSLRRSEIYVEQISGVLSRSDELSYFNLGSLLPIILEEEEIPKILRIFSTFSSGKNYFPDGISSINYLRIK